MRLVRVREQPLNAQSRARPRSAVERLRAHSGRLRPLLAGLLLAGCLSGAEKTERPAPAPWTSRATVEGQGPVTVIDGKRMQIRYGAPPFTLVTANFEQWPSYAYHDTKSFPAPRRVPMPPAPGDPKRGRGLFMSREKGPCTGCHLIPGDDVWPAGNVGPDLSVIGDRRLPNQYLFDFIWDARLFIPDTSMTPWGVAGILAPEEVVHVVAFLQTLKGNPPFVPPPEKDPARNPHTRPRIPANYGDNLDPTANPALTFADEARAAWSRRGPAGKACADCHPGGIEQALRGAATRYPKYVPAYGRIMSIEDFLTVHAPETTGTAMLAQSAGNLNMTMLIKMQSNGIPVNVDVTSPDARAAYERGRALYYKRVGQRNHACAHCHDVDKGAGRFAGGRVLSVAQNGLTRHFPLWFTNADVVWNIRHRFQFCMLPLGMNYLPADAPEYADLELYLAAFDNGKPMSAPGIR